MAFIYPEGLKPVFTTSASCFISKPPRPPVHPPPFYSVDQQHPQQSLRGKESFSILVGWNAMNVPPLNTISRGDTVLIIPVLVSLL